MRIGRKMRQAAEYVSDHPGCMKIDVAKHVGPHKSLKYGYEIVNRAIEAKLIEAKHMVDHYALYPGEKSGVKLYPEFFSSRKWDGRG